MRTTLQLPSKSERDPLLESLNNRERTRFKSGPCSSRVESEKRSSISHAGKKRRVSTCPSRSPTGRSRRLSPKSCKNFIRRFSATRVRFKHPIWTLYKHSFQRTKRRSHTWLSRDTLHRIHSRESSSLVDSNQPTLKHRRTSILRVLDAGRARCRICVRSAMMVLR